MGNAGRQVANEREATHGHYAVSAELAQKLKKLVRDDSNAWRRTPAQNEALDMILFKVARIVTGDPNHVDHWRDVAGYAELVMRELGVGTDTKAPVDTDRLFICGCTVNHTSRAEHDAYLRDKECLCPDCRSRR